MVMRVVQNQDLAQDERNLRAFNGSLLGKEERSGPLGKDIDFHLKNLATDNVKMLNCSDHCLAWFVVRMFSFTSSSTEAALRRTAPFIPTEDSDIHSAFERVLRFAGLRRHLSSDDSLTENTDEESSGSATSDDPPIDGNLIRNIITSMRLPTQYTVNKCARDARRIAESITNNTLTPAKMEAIMVALGFSRDRAGAGLSDSEKTTKLKKWIKSITDYEVIEDPRSESDMSASDSPDEPSSATVSYKFPYDLLNANEVKALLQSRVQSAAIITGTVPGPIPNPTLANQRREVLQWLDDNPNRTETRSGVEQTGEDTSLRDAILSGTVSRAFLKSLEGKDKATAKLGHQNEASYIKQYFDDSKDGRVPGVKLCDAMRCGLAMKQGAPFVRDSADAIAFEIREPSFDDIEDFDRIASHIVECKCRVGAGTDGSLAKAHRIQKRVASRKGGNAHTDVALGRAVYLRVSSSEEDLLAELIPSKSERIQTMHHAYTYGRDTVAYLVGDPHGTILFGIIITYEEELLECYGKALHYLYDNGLNLFYGENIQDLPLDIIEGILLSTPSLKSKFQLDDFVTSYLIWRELLPNNPDDHKFPIPPCDMLLPFEHSTWNSSKGGSDTVTRFAWNCLSVLPVKMPQTAIMARFFLIYAVLFHRTRQVVTMRKKIDINTDTIQSVRERNNKRYAFHETLGYISKDLLRMRTRGNTSTSDDATNATDSNTAPQFKQKDAARYRPENASKRYKTDHAILGRLDDTGVTPIGRGKAKSSLERCANYDEYKDRADNCRGCPIRFHKSKGTDAQGNPTGFDLGARCCDLCNTRAVSWMCNGCKRVLCVGIDRSKAILKRLKHKDHGPMLRRRFPALAKLPRGDVPAFYTDIGAVNGNQIFAGMSCFQIAHPKHFEQPCSLDDGNEGDPSRQLSAVAESAAASAPSPAARST